MMFGILIGTILGFTLGAVSGLVPGIHSNTIAGVLLGLQPLLLPVFGVEALASAMFATLITHTFLGVPDPDTALSVLPAHQLTLEGKGEEAVRIAALGCACGLLTAMLVVFPVFFLLPVIQPFLDWGIGLILVAVAGFLIVSGESPPWALAIFIFSGIVGSFSLHFGYLCGNFAGGTAVLMPLLCGLFGIPVLIHAVSGLLPEQHFSGIHMKREEIRDATLRGTLAGLIVGWLPGLSNATANAFLATSSGLNKDRRRYILSTNAANTANAVIGLAAFFSIARMRNGVVVAIAAFNPPSIMPFLVVATLAGILAYLLTIGISRYAVLLGGINIRTLNIVVIVFVIVLCLALTGPFGAFILFLAILIGFLPTLLNVPRLHCMGAIVLPVILYAFGFQV
ncbi:MAG: tripartite tricarboxylate transporter permease [Methanoregulaceae archaeon]|nr:tripartite tricarboxylate transporter permease [Methanoregulaceae archaeon]